MERPSWAPENVDLELPSPARIHDYYLGGSHHVAADRKYGEQALVATPEVVRLARANRAFLGRAVRYLVARGVRQFVDLGSGLPTEGSTHEVAQGLDPEARVVYVDIDPTAVAHGRAILGDNPYAAVVAADLREPAEVLASRAYRSLINMDRPVGVLLVGVLHLVPDTQHPEDILAGYAAAAAPGSHLVVADILARTRWLPGAGDLAALFGDDLTLVEPGVVAPDDWHPDGPTGPTGPTGAAGPPGAVAAVARKD